MSRMTRFLDDNVKCSFMMQHMCPSTGIGCTMCNYFAKGSCNSVCTVTDVICNANYMRCFGTKNDQCFPQERRRHQEKDYTPLLKLIVCKNLLFCKSHFPYPLLLDNGINHHIGKLQHPASPLFSTMMLQTIQTIQFL